MGERGVMSWLCFIYIYIIDGKQTGANRLCKMYKKQKNIYTRAYYILESANSKKMSSKV